MQFELTEYGVLCRTRNTFGNAKILRDAASALWVAAHPEDAGVLLGVFGTLGKKLGGSVAFAKADLVPAWEASLVPPPPEPEPE